MGMEGTVRVNGEFWHAQAVRSEQTAKHHTNQGMNRIRGVGVFEKIKQMISRSIYTLELTLLWNRTRLPQPVESLSGQWAYADGRFVQQI